MKLSDPLIALASVPELIPPSRSGKKLHVSVVYRWASTGCRGALLETLTIAGRGKFTTQAALDRFFAEISGRAPVERRTPSKRVKAMEAAEQRFAAAR
jgi:hypothetical protein